MPAVTVGRLLLSGRTNVADFQARSEEEKKMYRYPDPIHYPFCFYLVQQLKYHACLVHTPYFREAVGFSGV
jgi:hypothetical protein